VPVLKGRLGLETARVPQADRHGLLWLRRGKLYVESGTLRFVTAGSGDMEPGDYALPFQTLSALLLEPGTTLSHDALRLCARHGTGLVAVAEGGVRFYASMPFGPDRSARARRQAEQWANPERRASIARRMYAWRLGEVLPSSDLTVLRGIEGARTKETYRLLAQQFKIQWRRRRYDRDDPLSADLPNQAINHAATAVYALADVAVAVTGTIPQLGFIHEDSGRAFSLDIADLYRDSVTIPSAFAAVKAYDPRSNTKLERVVRRLVGQTFRQKKVVTSMIDRIKELFDGDDGGRHAERR
jgi:CRISPR-associated protein Cas1